MRFLCTEVLFGHEFAPIVRVVARNNGLDGEADQGDTPDWLPLALVAGRDLLEDFMWMFEVRLSDDRRLHAYKHIETRRYLHLDAQANAFDYGEDGRYRPVSLALALSQALRPLWSEIDAASGARSRAERAVEHVYGREEGADTIHRR